MGIYRAFPSQQMTQDPPSSTPAKPPFPDHRSQVHFYTGWWVSLPSWGAVLSKAGKAGASGLDPILHSFKTPWALRPAGMAGGMSQLLAHPHLSHSYLVLPPG